MNHACANASRKRRPRMYHTAPPGRPGASERLSLPVRLSRGFVPGGVRRLAMWLCRTAAADPGGRPLGDRSASRLFEHQSIVADVDRYAITFTEIALEHAHRERVEDAAL